MPNEPLNIQVRAFNRFYIYASELAAMLALGLTLALMVQS